MLYPISGLFAKGGSLALAAILLVLKPGASPYEETGSSMKLFANTARMVAVVPALTIIGQGTFSAQGIQQVANVPRLEEARPGASKTRLDDMKSTKIKTVKTREHGVFYGFAVCAAGVVGGALLLAGSASENDTEVSANGSGGDSPAPGGEPDDSEVQVKVEDDDGIALHFNDDFHGGGGGPPDDDPAPGGLAPEDAAAPQDDGANFWWLALFILMAILNTLKNIMWGDKITKKPRVVKDLEREMYMTKGRNGTLHGNDFSSADLITFLLATSDGVTHKIASLTVSAPRPLREAWRDTNSALISPLDLIARSDLCSADCAWELDESESDYAEEVFGEKFKASFWNNIDFEDVTAICGVVSVLLYNGNHTFRRFFNVVFYLQFVLVMAVVMPILEMGVGVFSLTESRFINKAEPAQITSTVSDYALGRTIAQGVPEYFYLRDPEQPEIVNPFLPVLEDIGAIAQDAGRLEEEEAVVADAEEEVDDDFDDDKTVTQFIVTQAFLNPRASEFVPRFTSTPPPANTQASAVAGPSQPNRQYRRQRPRQGRPYTVDLGYLFFPDAP